MPLFDFLRNLKIGASLRAPTVQSDSPRIDAKSDEWLLARAALWLTPKVVEGYDPADFSNLTPNQRQRLSEAVARFRVIADQVPPTAPATKEQFQQGLAEFNRILEILAPYLEDPEAMRTLEILMQMEMPDFVVGVHCETDEDSSGETVLDIWLIVANEAVSTRDFWEKFDALQERIDERLRAEGIQRWWHVDVRTTSEHLESLVSHEP